MQGSTPWLQRIRILIYIRESPGGHPAWPVEELVQRFRRRCRFSWFPRNERSEEEAGNHGAQGRDEVRACCRSSCGCCRPSLCILMIVPRADSCARAEHRGKAGPVMCAQAGSCCAGGNISMWGLWAVDRASFRRAQSVPLRGPSGRRSSPGSRAFPRRRSPVEALPAHFASQFW